MTSPIIRIDTNQGIYGLGEVRDGASKTYALMLKSRLLGENPQTLLLTAYAGSISGDEGLSGRTRPSAFGRNALPDRESNRFAL